MERKHAQITACYIVKDEEEKLAASLASIQQAVDEIVVVDTGSTDRTKAVAQEFGAKLYDYKWQDDFAAARNFALAQLKGDWVIFLDADEYFSADTAGNLRRLIEAQAADTNLLLVQRQDVDEQGKTMMYLYVPRIFRIRQDLRYVGAIHEELRQQGDVVKGIVRIAAQDAVLIHTGYAGALGPAKAQRNLTMLLREMENSAEPEHFYGYLAEAYDGIDDRENAMKYAYLDIARGRQAETYASRSYRLLLAKLSERKKDYRERQRIAKLAMQDYPELPEFHAEYAESLAADWHYKEASQEMRQACEMGRDYQGLEPSLFHNDMKEVCQNRADLFARLARKGEQLKITACVIAKNEAENIVSWLENAQKYANQCLLLDTGSTDNTCELATGAEIHHYEWQDDFAAARNEALQYVRGDWVAFMDADETFVDPEQVRGALAECEMQHPDAEALRLTIRNVDADDGRREISRFCNIRLFRNKPELRYQGRVHENLFNCTGAPLNVWEEPLLEVIHTGYSSGRMLQKSQRNLALLQQDIAVHGEQPHHYRYLASCYYDLGDYQQAQLYALKAIEAPIKGLGTHGDMYYMVLLCMKALDEPEADQLAFAQAASNTFPARADFPAVMGSLYQEAGNYAAGEKYLRHALSLARQSDGRESSAFGDLEALVYAKLAYCEAQLGKAEAARLHSRQAMHINPHEEQVLAVFCALRQDNGEQLVTELRDFFAAGEQEMSFLCRFCERNGFGFLYGYYRQELNARYARDLPRQEYYKLLQQGGWSELSDRLQAGLAHDLGLTIELLLRLQREEGKKYRQAERQLADLLPADMQLVWRQIALREQPSDWQLYQNIWPHILDYGDTGQIVRYAQLALGQQEVWPELLAKLLQREKWQAAFELLAMVPQEQADGRFWLDLGRCLYHLGEYPASREALNKARQEGLDSLLLKSYEKWLAKAG